MPWHACRQQLPQPEPSMAALTVEGMSLDRFMAKHTSEDNASFAQIMVESNKRRRLNKPWLFEQKDKVSHSSSSCLMIALAMRSSLFLFWLYWRQTSARPCCLTCTSVQNLICTTDKYALLSAPSLCTDAFEQRLRILSEELAFPQLIKNCLET